jgi:hypothetical protein
MIVEYLKSIESREEREKAARGFVGAMCNRRWHHLETGEAYSGMTFRMLGGFMAKEMNDITGFHHSWRMGRIYPCCKVCGHDEYCHSEQDMHSRRCSCEEKEVNNPSPCGLECFSYPMGERAYFYCDFYNSQVPDSDPWVQWMREKGFVDEPCKETDYSEIVAKFKKELLSASQNESG